MLTYIYVIDLYAISNTFYEKMRPCRRTVKHIEISLITIYYFVSLFLIFSNQVYFAGEGEKIYSYGIPSDTVYIFSTVSVIYVVLLLLVNMFHIPPRRQLSIYFFCIMEGIVAIVQMLNKELLIIGFGSSVAVLIMYFTLENPDMDIIARLNDANKKNDELLRNILPVKIAERLQKESQTFTQEFNDVTIFFLDIVNFFGLSNEIGSVKIVKLLNTLFSRFDDLLDRYSIEKIKTIGDAYMTAAGVPQYYPKNCEETINFAKDVLKALKNFNEEFSTNLRVRIGINNGAVVAGIIGKRKFIYDIWGATVNLASRMESYGVENRITVSPLVYEKLRYNSNFNFEEIPARDIKGFGHIKTYILV